MQQSSERLTVSGWTALWVALGVGAWVPFLFLFLGLFVTNGSGWVTLWFGAGMLLAWQRARGVSAWREGDVVTVRNFHSTKTFQVQPSTRLVPFDHWAQPNFPCLALHTPGERLLQVHAAVEPQRPSRAQEADQRVSYHLGVPLHHRGVGTWRQLTRRW